MKQHSLILLVLLFGFCFFSVAVPTMAQFSTPIQTPVSVDITPENPGPNQTVSVVIDSYATDLNAATITWKINGKTVKSGNGLKTFSFTTGNMNVNTELDIVINTKEGENIEKTYNIKPTSVDLIWQTDGYTPPFYKGKTLFGHQNKIQFIALPHIIGSNGQEIAAKNLIYKWTRNGTVVGDFSGYGRNTYTMIASIISRPLDIEVEVTSPDSNGVGYAETVANPIEPMIVMYEKSPLYGIQFQKALTNTVELNNSKEIAVIASPFFFGVTNAQNQNLQYKWAINGVSINNGTDPTIRVFRQKEGTVGTSYISLSIENADKILQYSSNGFNLKFGTPNTTETAQNF
jgi:hypothetical protein